MSKQHGSEPEKGHKVGNLQDVDARFKCTYCQLLLREPMQGDCGHRYCKNCVQLKFNEARLRGQESLCTACEPSERAEISADRTYPDNAIKREINKTLQVQCPNSPCEEMMQLTQLDEHLQYCEFKPQPCNLCGDLVSAARMSEHKDPDRGDCPRRPSECTVCHLKVPFDTLDEHKSTTCIGSTVECEYCQARVKEGEEAMDNHRKSECPVGWHEKNPCPYGCTEMKEGWEEHRLNCLVIHLDRLFAKVKQRGSEQPQLGGSDSKRTVVVADSSRGETATAVLASELPAADFDELLQLKERARMLERRLAEMPLPLSVLTGESGDPGKARKYLEDLQNALGQGDRLNELLIEIKAQFDTCYEKIRQYEMRMQKDLEKKLDIERKHQELVKLLAYKEMKILDLERRIEILEHAGYDGVLIWKITDVRRRKEEAREGKVCSIYSPPFYTGKAGYKMCGRLYLNGDGAGKNTHISLFFVIMRGAYDALLPWPFSKKVSMMLLDQNFEEHVIDAFKPDTSSSSFKRPTTDMNIASGCPLFMPLSDFENGSRGYVKDETMFIKFIVDKSDLPT